MPPCACAADADASIEVSVAIAIRTVRQGIRMDRFAFINGLAN
jgi:hypothetical protein